MNPKLVLQCLEELRALPYFTADEGTMTALLRLVGNMATEISQVRWLVARMTSGIYDRWPGPQEMRACFCSRFAPKDGLTVFSAVYPDRWPKDPTARPAALPPATLRELPPGDQTADAEIQAEVSQLADKISMPPRRRLTGHDAEFAQRLAEVITPPAEREDRQERKVRRNYPMSPARRIEIQAMIDAEMQKRRKA